ncbi:alpha/beta hydrolase [Stigmatella sp. ncwal1]|uniref:Alpha/beta hydrolase n=1 Tax=Stigmatella ashevillensis TaxID=2995309 RepID=A0ABT5DB04_9BACT|nr:alpha/beta hydrolase [Stigmatella ashevillena]MDC0710285.1 alpha/beta hydrolase [Stigmatella ashevillena]
MIRKTMLAALVATALTPAAAGSRPVHVNPAAPTVILVHGAFADGSSWNKVIPLLEARGVPALAVQNPLTSLQDDVATTRRAIAAAPGKVVLVGHSWGGTVITEVGNDDKVVALVYVSAFAPDVGENSAQQGEHYPTAPGLKRLQERDGFLWLPAEAVAEDFAQDLKPATARLLYSTQGPLKASALSEPVTRAAWKHKPSWYVLNREDRMLAPQLQSATAQRIGARLHSVPASHVSMLSHPGEVADIILDAAGVKSAAPSSAKAGG